MVPDGHLGSSVPPRYFKVTGVSNVPIAMAAPATQPKSRGRQLTRDPPTKTGFVRAVLREGLADDWVPSLRHQTYNAHGTIKRTSGSNAPSRSASTTASDASEPKRARWDNQTDAGLAEQAWSATGVR